jgi:hypothetical protein
MTDEQSARIEWLLVLILWALCFICGNLLGR